jgi:hypothetical protein
MEITQHRNRSRRLATASLKLTASKTTLFHQLHHPIKIAWMCLRLRFREQTVGKRSLPIFLCNRALSKIFQLIWVLDESQQQVIYLIGFNFQLAKSKQWQTRTNCRPTCKAAQDSLNCKNNHQVEPILIISTLWAKMNHHLLSSLKIRTKWWNL